MNYLCHKPLVYLRTSILLQSPTKQTDFVNRTKSWRVLEEADPVTQLSNKTQGTVILCLSLVYLYFLSLPEFNKGVILAGI